MAASEAQDGDGLNIRRLGLTVPDGQVLPLPGFVPRGCGGCHPLPQYGAQPENLVG